MSPFLFVMYGKEGWSEVKVAQSCLTLYILMDYIVHVILQARILEWVALPFSRASSQPRDWSLSHCRWILCQLSHEGSPRKLEWVAYPFPRESSQPRNRTGVPCIAGGFFTNWAIREACEQGCLLQIRLFSFHYLLIANIIPVQIAFSKDSFCLRDLLILSTALLGIKKKKSVEGFRTD